MHTNKTEEAISQEIIAMKEVLGTKLLIPAHHYQQQEVAALGDVIGDSYKLALLASRTEARYILLCGVRFMAESAAILSRPEQRVIIPDTRAGCPMADMMSLPSMRSALDQLESITGKPVAPLTYMNSYGDVKALTGEKGGAICTSSNAEKLLSYYIEQNIPIFFSPDYNLGINSAIKLGLSYKKIFTLQGDGTILPVQDPVKSPGTGSPALEPGSADPSQGLLFIWDGYCRVHKRFSTTQAEQVRQEYPGIKVIVHPECDPSLVAASDDAGSTGKLYSILKEAPDGTSWAVGTELNFVRRAAADFPNKRIIPLHNSICGNMARIGLEQVHKSLSSILAYDQARPAEDASSPGEEEGLPQLPGLIEVSPEVKRYAEAALRRMIELTEG